MFHRTIRITHAEASKNKDLARKNSNMYQTFNNNFAFNFNLRISKYKGRFKKGHTPNYTDEMFVITGMANTDLSVYSLTDLKGEHVIGAFYQEQLPLVKQIFCLKI